MMDSKEAGSTSSLSINSLIPNGQEKGMNFYITAFFLVAQVAGAGFLALPSAIAATGWIGIPMMILFCGSIAFSGTRLGHCWVMLEERYPEYRQPSRQPYMEIAYRSYGVWGRRLVLLCVLITLIGTTIIYLILIAEFMNSLIPDKSICFFSSIFAVAFIPFTWLGTPKDLWQASVLAVVATAFACLVIFIQLLMDTGSYFVPHEPSYQNPSFSSFSLGFGVITAAFGGASAFPSFQNDMRDRSEFWKSIVIGFIVLLIMYLPVAVTGYAVLGYGAADNILLYRGNYFTSTLVKTAIVFEIINLLGSFVITFNPIGLILEEVFNVPPKFGWQRCLLRTSIIAFDLIIALALPDFGLILNLVGGSTITVCSFLMPPLMYMKLVDDNANPNWPKRNIPTWERIFLYEIVAVGLVGGICSTVTAVRAIISSTFSASCFAQFY